MAVLHYCFIQQIVEMRGDYLEKDRIETVVAAAVFTVWSSDAAAKARAAAWGAKARVRLAEANPTHRFALRLQKIPIDPELL